MTQFDDDEATEVPTASAGLGDETELARRAGAGDEQAFDLLFDRYFARTSWYFTIFARREAKAAVQEVLTELFGSLTAPSDLSFAERAYRLARATELRHAAKSAKAAPKKAAPKKAAPKKAAPAKVEIAKDGAAKTLVSRV